MYSNLTIFLNKNITFLLYLKKTNCFFPEFALTCCALKNLYRSLVLLLIVGMQMNRGCHVLNLSCFIIFMVVTCSYDEGTGYRSFYTHL